LLPLVCLVLLISSRLVDANWCRYRYLLHCHDCCGGWRQTSCSSQAPRYVYPNTEGELHGMAFSTDYQLPSHATPVPGGKLSPIPLKLLLRLLTNRMFSHSYPQSVLLGRHIYHCPMLQKMSLWKHLLDLQVFVWHKWILIWSTMENGNEHLGGVNIPMGEGTR
jgi:hypothetical protein